VFLYEGLASLNKRRLAPRGREEKRREEKRREEKRREENLNVLLFLSFFFFPKKSTGQNRENDK
jgi:hypothetical protein